MASHNQVKKYLAYWLQLGQGVRMSDPTTRASTIVKPASVLADGAYSNDFESLWAQVQQPKIAQDSHLWGTEQTIGELLTPLWEINDCARCGLPIPMRVAGLPANTCPCSDVEQTPDLTICPPREPISTEQTLYRLHERLSQLEAV
jgi:hypothetical protein